MPGTCCVTLCGRREELEKRRAVGAAVSAYEEALRVHGKNSPEAKAAQRDLDRVLHQALE